MGLNSYDVLLADRVRELIKSPKIIANTRNLRGKPEREKITEREREIPLCQ